MAPNAATDAPWTRFERDLYGTVALRLQPSRVKAVEVKGMMLLLIAVAVLAFAAGSHLIPQPVISSLSRPQAMPAARDTTSGVRVDAYGNEVTNAVAEYSLDPTGGLYERHAPQIELPRLGSPKS
jgi:hypothetical protein